MNKFVYSSAGALTAREFVAAATGAIDAGELGMIDCHNVLAEQDSAFMYVDATHYSPRANEALARCILDGISATQPAKRAGQPH
jgi:hypothetical protein